MGLVLFALFSAGCSTLHSKASKLMDEKVYDKAEAIYQEILKSNPKDEKAMIGLKKAREGTISTKLIEVRQLRLGGDSEQSAEVLLRVLNSLRDWNVYPTGAVAFTQAEEMDFAVRDIEEQARIALAQNHPLRIAYLIERYRGFFQEKKMGALGSLRARASERGLDNCRTRLKSTPKDLTYYREFLARQCVYWGDQRPDLKEPISHGLFNQLTIQGMIAGLPETMKARFENDLQGVIQKSPWFDPAGPKKLSAAFDGAYKFQSDRRPMTYTHAYEEQEPYTSEEWVTKTRSRPVTVTKSYTQPDGKLGTMTTTEYASETYTERETVTRTRTVTRHFTYYGTEIEQNMSLNSTVRIPLLGPPAALTAAVADRNLTSESQTHIPSKGLNARTAVIRNENEWFDQILPKWRKQNADQLRDLWRQAYCAGLASEAAHAKQGNSVFQCLRDDTLAPPPGMNAWLERHEGVSAAQLRAVLKQ